MLVMLFACQKENEKVNTTLVGKWKLMAFATSDGGALVERPAPSEPSYMEFKSNGEVHSTPVQVVGASGISQYSIDGNKVTITSTTGIIHTVIYEYTIEKGILKIWPIQPMCIEGCYRKFVTAR